MNGGRGGGGCGGDAILQTNKIDGTADGLFSPLIFIT